MRLSLKRKITCKKCGRKQRIWIVDIIGTYCKYCGWIKGESLQKYAGAKRRKIKNV